MTCVKCDYCGGQAKLVKGKKVYPHRNDLAGLNFWYCDNGHDPAYVGCHKKNRNHGHSGIEPLGRLANAKLRNAKSMAHGAFDPLWRHGSERRKFKSRKRAYNWLADQLKIDASECHIGMFNEEMCGKVMEVCLDA